MQRGAGGFAFERRAAGIYHNTCAVLDADGTFLGKYRKMHIPDDPLYYEKFYFTPGDLGFPNFDTKYARIGVQICWDQWYPEGSRLTALSGAQVIFYPTSIGWHPHEKEQFGPAQLDAWSTIQRSHAIANGVYAAVVNRVGFEGGLVKGDAGLEFWGNSFVADPFGKVISQASNDREEILVVECDPAISEDTRRNWPFCGIGALTPTSRSLTVGSRNNAAAPRDFQKFNPSRSWVSDACGVGTAPSDVARLAA